MKERYEQERKNLQLELEKQEIQYKKENQLFVQNKEAFDKLNKELEVARQDFNQEKALFEEARQHLTKNTEHQMEEILFLEEEPLHESYEHEASDIENKAQALVEHENNLQQDLAAMEAEQKQLDMEREMEVDEQQPELQREMEPQQPESQQPEKSQPRKRQKK